MPIGALPAAPFVSLDQTQVQGGAPLAAPAPPGSLDYITIGFDRSPGRISSVTAERVQGWDIRKAYAFIGATIIPTGAEVTEVSVGIDLWLAKHFFGPAGPTNFWLPWNQFAKKYLNKPVLPPQGTAIDPSGLTGNFEYLALSIDYPTLRLPPLEITKVVFKACSAFQKDEYGLYSATMKFLEFRPARLVTPGPKAVIPAKKQAEPVAKDAHELVIQDLERQVRDELPKTKGPF
jgi:hypothetical protein